MNDTSNPCSRLREKREREKERTTNTNDIENIKKALISKDHSKST